VKFIIKIYQHKFDQDKTCSNEESIYSNRYMIILYKKNK